MKSRELMKLMTDDGWVKVRVNGRHHPFKHPTKPGWVAVPHPKKSLPIWSLKSILKQAGVKQDKLYFLN